jgi:recombination protein RecT
MTTEIVPTKEKMDALRATVQDVDFQAGLRDILPEVIDQKRFAMTALAVVGRDPKLLQCTQVSLIRCMLQAASAGLEIGNELGHAYLVPFRDNKANTTVCTLILGYRGITQLLYRSGQVAGIYAQVVREGDGFEYQYGLQPRLNHTPHSGITAPITHAYAQLAMQGAQVFDVMTREEIEAIRTRSRANTSGPWVTDYPEMAKKTVLRRLAKLAPMSVEDQRMVTADERAETGLDQIGVFKPEIEAPSLAVQDEELSEEELEAKREYEAAADDEQGEL